MLKEILYAIKKPYHLLKTGILGGIPAEIKYGYPSKHLHITVITGTDGKTTTSTLLYHVLKNAGIKVGLLSTVAAYIGDEELETGLHVTSPQPEDMHKIMRKMVDQNITHLIMEVTSQGEYQYRTWGVRPQLAGITNVSGEHLDYHLTFQNYLDAKTSILRKSPIIVLNEDDQSYLALRRRLSYDHTIITYGNDSKIPIKILNGIKERFPEEYNQVNARLVYALAKRLGVKDNSFIEALSTFSGVPGRMERVRTKKRVNVIIDFAHTSQGLKAVLTALRKNKGEGRLIAVYGCAGLRDREKRPVMGKIGAELADLAIFTAEDPRTEDIWAIIRQMKEQLESGHNKIISIADRYRAIEFALKKIAKPGDTVALLGKGHEKSICYGTTEYPWSERGAVEQILAEK